MKEIRSIFFRVIFNLPLGFLFFKIIGGIHSNLCLNQIDMKAVFGFWAGAHLPETFWALIYISILLLTGEIVSILGEWLLNWLFCFPFLTKEAKRVNNFEKIIPFGKTYITSKIFINALKNGGSAGDFSEMHFALSRLLAGTAWLCLLVCADSVGWEVMVWCFVIIAAIILIAIIISFLTKTLKNIWPSYLMFLLSLLFILFLVLPDIVTLRVAPLLLAIILLLAACVYRFVANLVNYEVG